MKSAQANDETNLTEIEILTDGRILLFGASREVLELLDSIQSGRDPGVSTRQARSDSMRPAPDGQTNGTNTTESTTDPRSRCR